MHIYEWSLLSTILVIDQKINIFPSYMYLPIGQIIESERGNKQYFNLSAFRRFCDHYNDRILKYNLSDLC
jgi:hypothetical protein